MAEPALVGVHLREAGPGMVVDSDVGKLPAGAAHQVTPVAGHAVTGPHDATELFGVDVQHLARRLMFVANNRPHRIERLQARQAEARQQPPHCRDAAAHELGNAPHRHAQPTQLLDRSLQRIVYDAACLAGRGPGRSSSWSRSGITRSSSVSTPVLGNALSRPPGWKKRKAVWCGDRTNL